jgi:hypothetical protein
MKPLEKGMRPSFKLGLPYQKPELVLFIFRGRIRKNERGNNMLKIRMDNGSEYIVDETQKSLDNKIHNQLGILINSFVDLKERLKINPSHISSIEEVEE